MSEWLNVKLNTVTSYIKRGVSPKYVETVGYTIINQKCIRDNRVTYENSKLLDKTQKIVKEKYLQDGDVLVNSTGTGTLGRVAQYKEIEERVFCDSHVSIVRANELINKKFLSYYLSYSEPMIETYGKGATNQKELSPYDLGLIKINLPPLPTQQKIAKILSYYDDLIENNLKCIKLLEESARLTYEEWFLRFRIDGKELDINPDSGLPLGWELVKVGSLLQRIKNTVKIKSSEILESGKNPVIDQGADFSIELVIAQNGNPVNLGSHSASAQLRPTPTSSTLTATFTCTVTNASQGKLTMNLGYALTRNIASGKYYYDLELFNSSANSITRLIQGVARVTAEVTR